MQKKSPNSAIKEQTKEGKKMAEILNRRCNKPLCLKELK